MTKQSPSEAAHHARLLARRAQSGALATLRKGSARNEGCPYVSKVGITLDVDGSPLFLFSTLAAHTQDLLTDSRASLLLEAPNQGANPLQAARTTLVGSVKRLNSDKDGYERTRYLVRHPGATQYADFGDFSLWRMDVEKVHYVGGFGLSKWAKATDYLTPSSGLKAEETQILATLNGPQKNKFDLAMAQVTGPSTHNWQAVSIDTDGLWGMGPKGDEARFDFKAPAQNAPHWWECFTQGL